jgi:flagellar protein FlgJ
MADQALTQASNYFDLQGLDQLRQKAQANSKDSIREVANQFESMFASMLIKSMRQTNEAFETDSPFNNKQTKFYRDMQDNQLAMDISRHGSLGLADALVRQLDPSAMVTPESIPAEQLTMPGNTQQKSFTLDKNRPAVEFNKADKTAVKRLSVEENKTVQANTAALAIESKKQPEFTDKKSFIETLLPYAKKTAQALGVSPVVLIAQSALETGWGKKIINGTDNQSSLNLFNIKAHKNWQGKQVAKESLEVENGIGVKRRSNFRAYNSLAHSFADYGHFISSNKRYQQALQQGGDAERYIEELQQAGYATDPRYAEKIKTIMQDDVFKKVVAEGEIDA